MKVIFQLSPQNGKTHSKHSSAKAKMVKQKPTSFLSVFRHIVFD